MFFFLNWLKLIFHAPLDMLNNVKDENIAEIAKLKNEKKVLVKEIRRLHTVTKGNGR